MSTPPVPEDALEIRLQFETDGGPAVALDETSGRRIVVPEDAADELGAVHHARYVLFSSAGRWYVAAIPTDGDARDAVVVEAVSEPLHE